MKRVTAMILAMILCLTTGGMVCYAQEADTQDSSESTDRLTIDLDKDAENAVEDALEQYADLEGSDAKLSLTGYPSDILRFLNSISFHSLDLELTGSSFTSFHSGDFRLADVSGLTALTCVDNSSSDYDWSDVFEDLESLTLIYDGSSAKVLGRMPARQMPALKHLQVEFADPETFHMVMTSQDWYLLPGTLETVEFIVGGKAVSVDELTPDNYAPETLSEFLGMLMCNCPNVVVNEVPLMELPAIRDKKVDAERLGRDAAAAYACRIYDQVENGSWENVVQEFPEPIYGKLLFVEFSQSDGAQDLSLDHPEGYRDGAVPEEMLAGSLSDADQIVILYEDHYVVGMYMPSGTAYQTDTMMLVADLNTGAIYQPYTVVSNDPPSSITVQTINGIPMGGSGYGDYEPDKAVELVVSSYDSSVPGKADGGGAAAPEEPEETVGEITAELETTAEEVEEAVAAEEAEAAPAEDAAAVEAPDAEAVPPSDDILQEVLAAFDDPVYSDTLSALEQDGPLAQNTVSETARGLQQTLVDLGCDIDIDGSAGPGTFAALNKVLAAFGKDSVEAIDAPMYSELLMVLLLSRDEEGTFSDLLKSHFEEGENSGEYRYLQACAYFGAERYYKAQEAFLESNYKDYEVRAAACPQPWPSNGELYHDPGMYSYDMNLTFQVNMHGESEGMCFEVYAEDGTLASVLFITGNGSVSTSLPGGNYRIKDAVGMEWYGLKDVFGKDGAYEFMSFDEIEGDPYLTWLGSGYEWTITINVQQGDPSGTGVGSENTDWETWVD